ncbi:MAG: MerR family DNA-binding transcriptional regulator [Uliginosibacterium sp.]|nr:MerR family DNA-binding transcriptional regulator [Uliginosibacterium sp.]
MLKIGEIAAATGVSRDALRFYEKQGLIRAQRGENGYRRYAPETAELVVYIRLAQKLGFSLAEIAENLPELWTASDPNEALQSLLRDKVQVIDARIAELQALKQGLLARMDQELPRCAGVSREGGA